MKKIILFVVVFLSVGALALQGKKTRLTYQEKVVTKTVAFSIFAQSNYSRAVYKRSKAKIVLTVYKLKGKEHEILWEGIVDRGNLKNYPSNERPVWRSMTFYNIKKKEQIIASYKVIYNTKGSVFSYEKSCYVSSATGDLVLIGI